MYLRPFPSRKAYKSVQAKINRLIANLLDINTATAMER